MRRWLFQMMVKPKSFMGLCNERTWLLAVAAPTLYMINEPVINSTAIVDRVIYPWQSYVWIDFNGMNSCSSCMYMCVKDYIIAV